MAAGRLAPHAAARRRLSGRDGRDRRAARSPAGLRGPAGLSASRWTQRQAALHRRQAGADLSVCGANLMSLAFLTALLAQSLPAPGTAQWENVGAPNAGISFALDPASIARTGDR